MLPYESLQIVTCLLDPALLLTGFVHYLQRSVGFLLAILRKQAVRRDVFTEAAKL